MSDKVLSAFVVGLLEEVDEDTSNMKAFFHYNIQNETELEVINQFMIDSYSAPEQNPNQDLKDLLNELGISLN
jgi:hypothetical protein